MLNVAEYFVNSDMAVKVLTVLGQHQKLGHFHENPGLEQNQVILYPCA